MNDNNERNFDLATILSITSGKILTDMDNIFDILNYLSGDSIYMHQMPRLMQIAQAYVLGIYPQLHGVGNEVNLTSEQEVKAYVEAQKMVFGDSYSVSPMPLEMCQYIDPVDELSNMRSGGKR